MPTPYAISSDLVSAWPAKSLEVATYLDTALAAKTDLAMVQNAQTGTSYSYALADASKLLSMSNAASNTVLVTKQATVTWVTGTQLRIVNLGAGVTTLVADTGVTINGNVGLKQYQGGTLIRTASDVWLFVPTASSGGMDLITPTSVAGSGVTLSGGQVSFSAATTLSLNGVFSSLYDNYRIYLSVQGSTADVMFLRMRLAGTDNTAASWSYQETYVATNTVFGTGGTGATSGRMGAHLTTSPNMIAFDLFAPALAQNTSYVSNVTIVGQLEVVGGVNAVTTAYDGFTMFPGSGNITGKLRVYGLRNS